ncbi:MULTISPECIES: HepT-like ribonuclease domain-containing protein [Butyricimonas]|uniref:HepT-like ribonuclease domain-containing protein n=1 Tax=Butyricimonas TaxID=574697 RepID=UPI000A8A4D04|nr:MULTISPECIES: HepT-like ribonuclease domain-containing protein [Butyricimonas]
MFEEFCRDIRLQRAIERCIEIIGEAMNRILKENKDIAINNARNTPLEFTS